jgi:hypothetical protein
MTDTTKPNGDRDRQDLGVQYHVLPDDPLAALNILREAAGLGPWSEDDAPVRPEPVNPMHQPILAGSLPKQTRVIRAHAGVVPVVIAHGAEVADAGDLSPLSWVTQVKK